MIIIIIINIIVMILRPLWFWGEFVKPLQLDPPKDPVEFLQKQKQAPKNRWFWGAAKSLLTPGGSSRGPQPGGGG